MVAKMKSYGQLNQRKPRFKMEKTKPQSGNTERKPLKVQTKESIPENPQKTLDDLQKKLKEQGILNELIFRENN